MTLSDLYYASWTDDATTSIVVRTRAGEQKTVTDYGEFGPPELWSLQRAIDGVAESIEWTPGTYANATGTRRRGL